MKKDTAEFKDVPTDDDASTVDEAGKRTRGRNAMRKVTSAQVLSSSASTKDKLRKANEEASKKTKKDVPPPSGSNSDLPHQSNAGGSQAASFGVHDVPPPQQHHGPASTYPPTSFASTLFAQQGPSTSNAQPHGGPPTTFVSTPFAQQGPSTSNLHSHGTPIVRPLPVVAGAFSQVHYDGASTVNPVFDMANALLPQPGWISAYGTQEQFISAGGTQFLPPWTDFCPVWSHGIFFTKMESANVVRAMSEIGISRESFLRRQISLVVL
jgi:hypothetical protein